MSTYTLSATVRMPWESAVAATREALGDQGFGILTEIDLSGTLSAKLGVEVGVDVARQVVLGACRPPLAYEAITADPSIATVLPCNVVVRAVDETTSVVEAFDPAAMTGLADVPALEAVATDARARITAALEALSARQED